VHKGSFNIQLIKLTTSLFNFQVAFYFEDFLVFTLQALKVLCFMFIALYFVLHCVFIMLFIV
jgi:hypothetical protein